jgi:hypothetical protein
MAQSVWTGWSSRARSAPNALNSGRYGPTSCHLDEMNIAYQLHRNRHCPDCGEPSPFGLLLHECATSGSA